jgi:hypothetical protein
LSEEENRLKKQIDGITKYLDIISVLLAEIVIKERPYKYCEVLKMHPEFNMSLLGRLAEA